MAEPTYIDDHVVRALANLTHICAGKPNIEAVVTALVDQVQDLEIAIYELITDRFLANASGAQLDQVGALVGEARGAAADDDEYRRFIAVRLRINRSNGEFETLIFVVKTLTGSSDVHLIPMYPAAIHIQYTTTTPLSSGAIARMGELLYETVAAGIEISVIESYPDYFGFLDDPNALGWNDGWYSSLVLP